MEGHAISRRQLAALGVAGCGAVALSGAPPWQPIVIGVQAMYDRGAHSGRGLSDREISLFKAYQEKARREYATSGIHFDVHVLEGGAYLRQQGYSEIPDKFLVRNMINLFVTETLGYDIDRDRTGGCSMGPRPPSRRSGGYPFYETYLGLREARDTTLPHEYAHQFTLDTQRRPTAAGNLWADLRNDYWLWRQRHGTPIPEFRACVNSPWARVKGVATGRLGHE
jgi:hypothetical protein